MSDGSGAPTLRWAWLGTVGYQDAWELQRTVAMARRSGELHDDAVLLLEHPPVYTMGRQGQARHLGEGSESLIAAGAEFLEVDRGGSVTFHGPGQLVAYPVFDLHPDRLDVRRYVRDLARVMVALARDHGVDASFIEGDAKLVGVWADEASPALWAGDPRSPGGARRPAKIGAIGVRLSRWVTMHGFAFNVSTDLEGFRLIVPCGIAAYGVTSLEALGAAHPSVEDVALASVAHFARTFEAEARMATADETRALRAV